MPRRIIPQAQTNEPAQNAEFEIKPSAPPVAFMRAQGLGPRDVALVAKYADALDGIHAALLNGDAAQVRIHYPALVKLAQDAERIRGVARKAISRRTTAVV